MFEQIGYLPTYYVVEDRLVAEDNAKEINALQGITKIFPEDLRYALKPSPETVFIRFSRFYCNPDNPDATFPLFINDDSLRFFWGGTVSYLNLQLAYYMGFSEVYVLGMDMDYQVPTEKSNVMVSNAPDDNHVHPLWFGPGKRWHDPRLDRMKIAFERAKQAFDRAGRGVYNATVGGKTRSVRTPKPARCPSLAKLVKTRPNVTNLSVIYAVGDVLSRGMYFVLLVALTALFEPSEYGVFATAMTVYGLLVLVNNTFAASPILRLYFDFDDPQKLRALRSY